MTETLRVIVEAGQVRSKSNYRRSSAAKWSSISAFETELAALLRQARPSGWQDDSQEKVSERPQVVAAIVARTMLDAGNLSKSILDAAEGVLFQNDASVVLVIEYAERGKNGQRSVVGFAQLPPGSSRMDASQAAQELFSEVSGRFDASPSA